MYIRGHIVCAPACRRQIGKIDFNINLQVMDIQADGRFALISVEKLANTGEGISAYIVAYNLDRTCPLQFLQRIISLRDIR